MFKIKITDTGVTAEGETKGKVVAEHAGTVHSGLFWSNDNGGPPSVRAYRGDKHVLIAALLACDGPSEFEISLDELKKRSQGWF